MPAFACVSVSPGFALKLENLNALSDATTSTVLQVAI